MTDKIDPKTMQAGEKIFWEEFNQLEYPGDRYIVIDSKKNEVIVQNAKLLRDKKKIRV